MVSLMPSASWSGALSDAPPSPSARLGAGPSRSPTPSVSSVGSVGGISVPSSRNSSNGLQAADEENATITASARVPPQRRHSGEEDLRLLTVSANITELSYTISDIQTRIFEIQELRHQTHGDSSGAATIDTALSGLDERLGAVGVGIAAANETISPVLNSAPTPTQARAADGGEAGALGRKHAALLDEWAAVQREAELLREELREDKWLTVFRTVTEQADGMMSSLEKAIQRCQDFLRQMRANEPIAPTLWPPDPERPPGTSPSTMEVFLALVETFEAKKRHYIPATNKVLSILDKGVQDRVTKNGECLRRHAESTQRWKSLQARLARTDSEMDSGRLFLLGGDGAHSEAGSSASGSTAVSGHSNSNGLLGTPPVGAPKSLKKSRSRTALTLSRSISPLRSLARKLKGGHAEPETPEPTRSRLMPGRTPASEPSGTLRRQRTSIFSFKSSANGPPVTPERAGHRPTQSMAQAMASTSRISDPHGPISSGGRTGIGPMKHAPAWNSSTKVDEDLIRERTATLRPSPQRRPSAMGFYASVSATDSPHAGSSGGGKRSLSRSSMASSRPWSPFTSSMSSNASSSAAVPPMPSPRPPSRSHIPAPPITPRSRPKTPSLIPTPRSAPITVRTPSRRDRQQTMSPSPGGSADASYFPFQPDTPTRVPPPRPPSRSMIPIPTVHLSAASRPGSAMSSYRPDTSMSVRPRTSMGPRAAPSAFHNSPRTPALSGPGPASRPGSRTGGSRLARMGSADGSRGPQHVYHALGGGKDPLDAAVAALANAMSHACVVERVDPPLRTAPAPGAELRATYAFSTPLGRKQLPLKLAAPGRDGTRKVLYRGGGGWTELREYLLAHPA